MKRFSIVIPAYNRSFCIKRAIDSALAFLSNDSESEIIIVDDGSQDNTINIVNSIISDRGINSRVSLITHKTNKGVCAAKNTGAKAGRGDWIIFLDSDDELIADSYDAVKAVVENDDKNPLHFFACIGEHEEKKAALYFLIKNDFNQYMRNGTGGEKIPIVKRDVFINNLYDEDMPGYESLSYMRIVKKYGYACIHNINVRRYYTSNQDRLSTRRNMKIRSALIAQGHLRALREHFSDMNAMNIVRQLLKYTKSKYIAGL